MLLRFIIDGGIAHQDLQALDRKNSCVYALLLTGTSCTLQLESFSRQGGLRSTPVSVVLACDAARYVLGNRRRRRPVIVDCHQRSHDRWIGIPTPCAWSLTDTSMSLNLLQSHSVNLASSFIPHSVCQHLQLLSTSCPECPLRSYNPGQQGPYSLCKRRHL